MKPWVKYSAATIALVGGVGGSVLYNQVVAPKLNSTWVYVATTDLSNDQHIRIPGNAKLVNMPVKLVSPDAITNKAELESLYIAEPMSALEQFTTVNTENYPFTLTANTQDVPVSSAWIASISLTIRQGDEVDMVPIVQKQMSMTLGGSAPKMPVTLDCVSLNHLLVLSVHTNQNLEVENATPGGPQTVGARQNGTGSPNAIDLKMTKLQAQLFEWDVQQGDQFMVNGVLATTNSVSKTGCPNPNPTPTTSTVSAPRTQVVKTATGVKKPKTNLANGKKKTGYNELVNLHGGQYITHRWTSGLYNQAGVYLVNTAASARLYDQYEMFRGNSARAVILKKDGVSIGWNWIAR